jgi:hypothetical protein
MSNKIFDELILHKNEETYEIEGEDQKRNLPPSDEVTPPGMSSPDVKSKFGSRSLASSPKVKGNNSMAS